MGRMMALEARRMGYRTVVLDPAQNSPAAQVADIHIQAPVDDAQAALDLAARCDVVTLEWELIPASVLEKIEAVKPLYPSSKVLRIIQDRLSQKEFLAKNKFPQVPFLAVNGLAELKASAPKIGFPCILKRRSHGYDGKGQALLQNKDSLSLAAQTLESPCVLEAQISFDLEISVILARGKNGEISLYPIARNVHRNGILHTTQVPAAIPEATQKKAQTIACSIAEALGHVGVMAVEMFVVGDDILVNEIAPRVHNSGHYTLGACLTSQFEQHLRAISGLPLGETKLVSAAVMVNLLGNLWREGEPNWSAILYQPNLKLHLYGKAKPAPGRKMGHILILGGDAEGSLKTAEELLLKLKQKTNASLC